MAEGTLRMTSRMKRGAWRCGYAYNAKDGTLTKDTNDVVITIRPHTNGFSVPQHVIDACNYNYTSGYDFLQLFEDRGGQYDTNLSIPILGRSFSVHELIPTTIEGFEMLLELATGTKLLYSHDFLNKLMANDLRLPDDIIKKLAKYPDNINIGYFYVLLGSSKDDGGSLIEGSSATVLTEGMFDSWVENLREGICKRNERRISEVHK